MRAEKKVLGELTLCYCVAPLEFRGKRHFLVASEKQHPCLLFDEQGVCVDQVWDGPGGTMTMVQLPGADGAFLATHRFYSPNDNKQASIVLCRWAEGTWQVRTLLDLPGVHRFDLLERGGVRYLIACTIKSDYAYKDDWRFPGKAWAAVLPDDLTDRPEDFRLEARVIAEGLTRNHGYSRHGCSGIVTAEESVFRFTPPETPAGEWTCEKLLDQPTSDALLLDFDGDGAEELLTLSPFHGDTLTVFKRNTGHTIVECFRDRGADPMAVPAVICHSHGPFTWGRDAAQAVYHAVVLEEVAKMAILTRQVNPDAAPAPQRIQDKHYTRKHGPNAYYGQGIRGRGLGIRD